MVDGSSPEIFSAYRRVFSPEVRHIPVDSDLTGRYGKVNGVVTGVRAATHERVLIADDDVRYDDEGLQRMSTLLSGADLVRPQNYFHPLPWHARWDTGRILVNRAFGADYPGTLGVRRSMLLAAGGYDGDCLFENLELIRTVQAVGGEVLSPLDFYVRRLPPPAGHFWSQRVRQAYDDFALPARMAAELAVVPGLTALSVKDARALLGAGLLAVATAEMGRRRCGGARVFPWTCSLMAPAWLAERGVCAWLAVWQRLRRGGVPYAGTVLSKAANSRRVLERRVGAVKSWGPSAQPRFASPSAGPWR